MADDEHSRTREDILEELGLAGIPPVEELLGEIEQQILLPKETIPHHWLSRYQM